MLLDIAPTYDVFERIDFGERSRAVALDLPSVPDLPEALTPAARTIYLRYLYRALTAYDPAAIDDEAVQEYVRCFRQPGRDARRLRRLPGGGATSISSTTAPIARGR